MNISFDYDHTLTTEKGLLALSLDKNHNLHVVTARSFHDNNEQMYKKLFSLGFKPHHIHFSSRKYITIAKLKIDAHVDNNLDILSDISFHTSRKTFNVNDKFFIRDFEEFLKGIAKSEPS